MSGGTINVEGSPTLGSYVLLQAGSAIGTTGFTTGALPGLYRLAVSGSQLDLIHLATLGSISASAADVSIVSGGSTAVTFTVANGAPVNSDSLNFTATPVGNMTGSASGTVAASNTSSSIGGLSFTGADRRGQTGTFSVSGGSAAGNGPLGGSVVVNVFDHASIGGFSGGVISLGNVHVGYTSPVSGANTLGVTNGSATDYRVNLLATGAMQNGVTVSGFSGVTPGSSGSLSATLATGRAAGAIDENVSVSFGDDSRPTARWRAFTLRPSRSPATYTAARACGTATALAVGATSVNGPLPAACPASTARSSASDAATFGGALTSGTATVSLNGVSPQLSSLTMSDSGGSYAIASGTGSGGCI